MSTYLPTYMGMYWSNSSGCKVQTTRRPDDVCSQHSLGNVPTPNPRERAPEVHGHGLQKMPLALSSRPYPRMLRYDFFVILDFPSHLRLLGNLFVPKPWDLGPLGPDLFTLPNDDQGPAGGPRFLTKGFPRLGQAWPTPPCSLSPGPCLEIGSSARSCLLVSFFFFSLFPFLSLPLHPTVPVSIFFSGGSIARFVFLHSQGFNYTPLRAHHGETHIRVCTRLVTPSHPFGDTSLVSPRPSCMRSF